MRSDEEQFGYTMETKASEAEMAHREVLYQLFRDRPLPDDQLLINLGLFLRSSALTKILFLNELYGLIVDRPGVIVEFGTWWGQNLVLFENLRAIYEPFNGSRRIIGFDTFEGYRSISDKDRTSETIRVGGYKVSREYRPYLEALLAYHQDNNVLRNTGRCEVVEGDAAETAAQYFDAHPETVVALAYFDMALYEPTKACLIALRKCLVPGSVIMFDELNSRDYPGETIAFKEVFANERYTLHRSKFMTDRSYLILG